jgi:hypothetical protein
MISPLKFILRRSFLNTVLDIKNSSDHEFKSFLDGALYWFSFGFDVIPLLPKDKVTAVKWDGWLESLSEAKITDHWTKHPDHEVGFIVGDGLIVFDADTPESTAKLYEMERAFDVFPLLVVNTSKGVHHYFKRSVGVFAKSDSHSTVDHPDRLDVKTGRAMVVLAPSTGKEVELCEVDSADELTEVDQGVVDAVARHNGRPVPRPQQPREISVDRVLLPIAHKTLGTLLSNLSADCGYDDWLKVLMAIYHETGGSEEGFELANTWSSQGKQYKGIAEMQIKWNSFKSGVNNPVTARSLTKMLELQGLDWMALCSEAKDSFERLDVEPQKAANDSHVSIVADSSDEELDGNPFYKFSLRGHSAEIERNLVEQVYVMDSIAIKGQYTMLYASPNAGKTLFSLYFLTEAVKMGRVNPDKLFYFNMDDMGNGLLEKNTIAEEYGFHMITSGFNDFTASVFLNHIEEMVENNSAKDVVLVLDTAKFFVNLMNKNEASAFNQKIRPFVAKGGTVIALAHTNKNPDQSGKSKFCGTSDMVDDCDCAYMLNSVSSEKNVKVVEFENIKSRGTVLSKVGYQFTKEDDSSYVDIFLSVKKVNENELTSLKQEEEHKTDAELINAVIITIKEGINSKMKLAETAGKRVDVSKRKMNKLIEKYTGEDPGFHKWKFTVGARGSKEFTLIDQGQTE